MDEKMTGELKKRIVGDITKIGKTKQLEVMVPIKIVWEALEEMWKEFPPITVYRWTEDAVISMSKQVVDVKKLSEWSKKWKGK